MGGIMSDYTVPVYCNDCHETGEPEVILDFSGGDEMEPYKEYIHCGFCGSSNVRPIDDLADGLNMEDDR
jgi:hypothetical protein